MFIYRITMISMAYTKICPRFKGLKLDNLTRSKSYLSMNITLSQRIAPASLRCGVAPLHMESEFSFSQLFGNSDQNKKW